MSYLVRLCILALLLSQNLAANAEPYNLGASRVAVMDDPWRIEFQDGTKQVTRQDIEQVVKIVGATQGWKVANSTEGRMELTNVIREHTMSVELTYDATGYGIRYLQSTNLLYKELAKGGGTLRVIHGNYNGWIKDLVAGINAGLGVPVQTTIGFAPLEKADAVPFLKEKGREAYKEFLSKPTPRAFAIAPNGAWASSFRRISSRRERDVVENAIERCNRRGKGECKLYALDNRVVWKKTDTVSAAASRALTGADLVQHIARFAATEFNPGARVSFTMSISADGRAERVCKDCPAPTGTGTVTVKSDEGIVCFQWEKVTYPDSGCYRVVPTGANAFEMRGTKRERPIKYSLVP